MGHARFTLREQAMAELEAIGTPALEPLRQACKSRDAETSRRAAELVRRIEDQQVTALALAPKKLRLQLTDRPVLQAVEDLARQSGYVLLPQGDHSLVQDRKIQLDTGETTFWEALDQLGARGGVTLPPPAKPTPQTDADSSERVVMVRGGKLRARMRVVHMPDPAQAQEPVYLHPGTPARHVSYAGAARVELHLEKLPEDKSGTVSQLIFDTAVEPRLQNFTVIGPPHLKRALDEHDRPLTLSENLAGYIALPGLVRDPRQTVLYLRNDESTIKAIKELSGTLPARLALPNELLVRIEVADLLKADGQLTRPCKSGGALQVNSFERLDNGAYRVQLTMENVGPTPFGNGVMMNGNINVIGNAWSGTAAVPGLPELLDGQGRKYHIEVTSQTTQLINNQFSRQLSLVYHVQGGAGAASELVLHGSRTVTIAIPFRFRDVAVK
jgi:hypothetical protein